MPLFVLDDAILGSRFAAPNRVAYMREALIDLDGRLKAMDGRLFLRRGQVVEEAMQGRRGVRRRGAPHRRRLERLRAAARGRAAGGVRGGAGSSFTAHPGVTILEPGAVTPTGGDHFKVFSPYHRAWSAAPWREGLGAPRKLSVPSGLAAGELPALAELTDGTPSPDREPGGETQARKRMHAFLRDRVERYEDGHDDLPGHGTSGLSAHIRWGCVSPRELARRGARGARRRPLRAAALLARLPPPGAGRVPRPAAARLPPARRPLVALGGGLRGLARRAHRLPAGRRRDAPAAPPRASCTTAPG